MRDKSNIINSSNYELIALTIPVMEAIAYTR